MQWEEFYERFVLQNEEFLLGYKDKSIWLLYPPKGVEGIAVYFLQNCPETNVFQHFFNTFKPFHGKKLIEEKIFPTREKLLTDFRIDGKTFLELWNEIDS